MTADVIKPLGPEDEGRAWLVRKGDVFAEDTLLCGGLVAGNKMCIRLVVNGKCPKHGPRTDPR